MPAANARILALMLALGKSRSRVTLTTPSGTRTVKRPAAPRARKGRRGALRNDATQSDEGELVRRMLARDSRAWKEFNAKYDRLVRTMIMKQMGRSSSDAVEEARAEFLASLIERDMHKLREYNETLGRLSTWIGTLAMRAAFDYLRKEQRRRISSTHKGASRGDDVGDEPGRDYFAELHAPMPDATEHLHARRTLATIARGMLTAEEKQIVAMKADGLSTEEIASAIGRPTKTVDTKVFRIRAKLRAEGIEL